MKKVPMYSARCDGLQDVMSSPLIRWLIRSSGTATRKMPVPHWISRSAARSTP
jgi:hypothetical protein